MTQAVSGGSWLSPANEKSHSIFEWLVLAFRQIFSSLSVIARVQLCQLARLPIGLLYR